MLLLTVGWGQRCLSWRSRLPVSSSVVWCPGWGWWPPTPRLALLSPGCPPAVWLRPTVSPPVSGWCLRYSVNIISAQFDNTCMGFLKWQVLKCSDQKIKNKTGRKITWTIVDLDTMKIDWTAPESKDPILKFDASRSVRSENGFLISMTVKRKY